MLMLYTDVHYELPVRIPLLVRINTSVGRVRINTSVESVGIPTKVRINAYVFGNYTVYSTGTSLARGLPKLVLYTY